MRLLDRVRHVGRVIFQRARVERELNEELGQWVEELTERQRARGFDPVEARRRALVELGGVESIKQTVRDERVGAVLSGVPQDFRYAWRALRHAPALTAVIGLTLAFGIGASTAIFSVVNTMLIAPLPYADPARLVFIWSDMTASGYPRAPLSGPELGDLRERGTRFTDFGGIWATTAALTGDGDPEQLRIGLVTTNFFAVLGAEAALGRTFGREDEKEGPASRILLSWAVFQRRYGGDPSLVGRRILVNGQPTTVVGVMPAGFRLLLPVDASVPDDLQAWVPLKLAALSRQPRGQQYLRVVGRMKPGVSVEEARQDVTRIAAAISREFSEYGAAGRAFTTVGLHDDGVRESRPSLVALFGGVVILSFIAWVNVAVLLLARASARRHETSLRMALGAGPGRLLRQCTAEGLLLAALGATGGLIVGRVGLGLLVAARPPSLERMAAARIDITVLAFTCGVSLLCGLLFSLAPLAEVFRSNLVTALQHDERRVAGSAWYRTRATLVVVQVALGVILLVGAGLFVRTLVQMQRVDLGFDSDSMLTFRLAIPFARYRTADAMNEFARRFQRELAALPGVTGVGAISHLPYDNLPNWGGPYLTRPGEDESIAPNADYRGVSPGFFEEVGARLVDGRFFVEADDRSTQPAVIVDDLLAARAWPAARAVGQRIAVDPGSIGHPQTWATVIGVVHHLRVRSLTEDLTEQVYFPVRQALRNPMAYVLRTSGNPADLAGMVRESLSRLDGQIPIYDVRPLESYTRDATSGRRFTAMLAACFAGAALLLACVGVYGVIAYAVARRRTEFGVRMALGARPSQVVALVLSEGAGLVGLGLTAGACGAAIVARLLRTQLFGVTPGDPAAYALALSAVALAGLLSCWLPARRAATSDLLAVLRSE